MGDRRDNVQPIDIYTVTHILAGISLYILFKLLLLNDKIAILLSFIIGVIYEGKDYYHTYVLNKADSSFINSVTDIGANLIGILAAFLFIKPSLPSLVFFTILALLCLLLPSKE